MKWSPVPWVKYPNDECLWCTVSVRKSWIWLCRLGRFWYWGSYACSIPDMLQKSMRQKGGEYMDELLRNDVHHNCNNKVSMNMAQFIVNVVKERSAQVETVMQNSF